MMNFLLLWDIPQRSIQFLFYYHKAEDLKQDMDRERRRQALTLFMYYLAQDIETEKKTVAGVQKLVDIYKSQPDYADYEAVEETKLQARQVSINTIILNFISHAHHSHIK